MSLQKKRRNEENFNEDVAKNVKMLMAMLQDFEFIDVAPHRSKNDRNKSSSTFVQKLWAKIIIKFFN